MSFFVLSPSSSSSFLSFFLSSSPFFVRYIRPQFLSDSVDSVKSFAPIPCSHCQFPRSSSSRFPFPKYFLLFLACFLLFYFTILWPCCVLPPPPPPSHLLLLLLIILILPPFFSFLELSFGCRLPFSCSGDFFFLRQLFASRTVLFLSVFQLLFSCSLEIVGSLSPPPAAASSFFFEVAFDFVFHNHFVIPKCVGFKEFS